MGEIAEEAERQLRASGAHQAGKSHNLALADFEVHLLEDLPPQPWVIGIPIFDLENYLVAGTMTNPGRVNVINFASNHVPDHDLFGHFALVGVQRTDGLPIAQNGDGVSDRHDLAELVRNHDAGDTVCLLLAQQLQQVGTVIVVQRGGGFIQDQQLHIAVQRLGNFHQLLLAHSQVFNLRGGVDIESHAGEHFVGPLDRLVPIHGNAVADFMTEKDILIYREFGDEGQLLIDDPDTGFLAVGDVPEGLQFALEVNVTRIGAIGPDATQHLHQRGLPRAVFPYQAMDLAFGDAKTDVVQSSYTRKFLGDITHFQNWGIHNASAGLKQGLIARRQE